jgi:hypothetical protein
MRCKACNRILEDKELTKKDNKGEFIDLCNLCLAASVKAGSVEDELFVTDADGVLTDDDFCDTLY